MRSIVLLARYLLAKWIHAFASRVEGSPVHVELWLMVNPPPEPAVPQLPAPSTQPEQVGPNMRIALQGIKELERMKLERNLHTALWGSRSEPIGQA